MPNKSLEELIKQRQQPNRLDAFNATSVAPRTELELSLIDANPYQPRKQFDDTKLHELATSIQQYGVFTPIIVRPMQGRYQLVSGERRVRASKLAGLTKIPALIGNYTDQQMREIALLENIQRQNLNRYEEAQAYAELMKINQWNQSQLATQLGKSRAHIANLLRLLKLPESALTYLQNGTLTMGQLRPLIGFDAKTVKKYVHQIIKNKLTARAVEQLVHPLPTNLVAKELSQSLERTVTIKNNQLIISFSDEQDLQSIIKVFKK